MTKINSHKNQINTQLRKIFRSISPDNCQKNFSIQIYFQHILSITFAHNVRVLLSHREKKEVSSIKT